MSSTAKKPVVLALNRGHYSSKTRRVVEWCLFTSPLEPFFKDKARCKSAFYPVPAPVPTAGTPPVGKTSFVHLRFVVNWLLCSIPDFGRFYGSRGLYMFGCRARQKPPSSLTRKRVHRRTGVFFCEKFFIAVRRLGVFIQHPFSP